MGVPTTTFFITARFDVITERAIADLLRRLTAEDVRIIYGSESSEARYRPHLTLAAFDAIDLGPYKTVVKEVSRRLRPVPIRFHSLGIFVEKNVLYLAPRLTIELLELHQAFHAAFSGAEWPPTKYEWLNVGKWTPHCTLVPAGSIDDLLKGIEVCARVWQPVEGTIEALGMLIPPATIDCAEYQLGAITDT